MPKTRNPIDEIFEQIINENDDEELAALLKNKTTNELKAVLARCISSHLLRERNLIEQELARREARQQRNQRWIGYAVVIVAAALSGVAAALSGAVPALLAWWRRLWAGEG